MKNRKLLIGLGIAAVFVILLAFLIFSKKEESYNQYRVANLGVYLYNQLKDPDVSDWKKRCRKCLDNGQIDPKTCKYCSQLSGLRENYYPFNLLRNQTSSPFSHSLKGIPIRKKKKILTQESDYLTDEDDDFYDEDSLFLSS